MTGARALITVELFAMTAAAGRRTAPGRRACPPPDGERYLLRARARGVPGSYVLRIRSGSGPHPPLPLPVPNPVPVPVRPGVPLVAPPVAALLDEHLAVDADRCPDGWARQCADVVRTVRPRPPGEAFGVLTALWAGHPGRGLAAVPLLGGGWAVLATGTGRFTVGRGLREDPVRSLLPSCLYGWLVAGGAPPAPRPAAPARSGQGPGYEAAPGHGPGYGYGSEAGPGSGTGRGHRGAARSPYP
ncbi:hypothetical protein ABT354_22490 [Streptomyces sp. NPDC000594]|uniref:hypothetical protein n=1 Tax=Streptomyces sp. NPDC000594 TaxID=3154261 RepID=UPI00332A4AFD